MRRSLVDKAFFLGIVDPDVIVDYGCADGSLLELVHLIAPSVSLVGYDLDVEMLRLAKERVKANFAATWTSVYHTVGHARRNDLSAALVLSSIVHEVYAYPTPLDEFYDHVYGTGFDHVAVRDMFDLEEPRSKESWVDSVLRRCDMDPGLFERLSSFEDNWGSISEPRNLRHFLMKYRFADNWDRENDEDYFSCPWAEFESRVPDDYEVTHVERYALPYNVARIRKDFGFTYDVPTHVRAVVSIR
jgi:hypothetical protein